jgi:hypothetical protein
MVAPTSLGRREGTESLRGHACRPKGWVRDPVPSLTQAGTYDAAMRRRAAALVLFLVAGGCSGGASRTPLGTSTTGPAPTSPSSSTSLASAPATAAIELVLPVVPCATTYGVQNNSHVFVPHQLPAATTDIGGERSARLSFYSNGRLTVLGPGGWACTALVATDGGERLDVYQAGQPDLSSQEVPPGTAVVQLDGEYTGHGPGAPFICPLFPSSPGATFLQGSPPCPRVPAAEQVTRLTDDIVTFRDPVGVRGTGAGSGGPLVSTGAAIYPQLRPEPAGGVSVHVLSCTLPADTATLCDAIEADFLVRNAPAYVSS